MIERSQDGETPETLRTVTLKGTQQQIEVALELLEEKLEAEEKFRNKVKVMETNREERNRTENRAHLKKSSVKVSESWEEAKLDAASVRQENLPLTDGFLQVYVSAVEHPSHFWLQVVGTKALHLERLQTELTTWVDTMEARTNFVLTDVVPGQLVAAKYEPDDPVYYRAKVLGENEKGQVDLYFVDFGDNTFADRSQVFKLRSDFQSFPFQAIECTLANAVPTGGVDSEWSEEAITAFEDLTYCAQWKMLHAKVVSRSRQQKEQWPLVELVDQELNIGQELIRLNLASPCSQVASNGTHS